jgi:hypothetical protein
MNWRRLLYRTARTMGDVRAVQRGTAHKRIVNKWIGRKIVRKLWWR